MIIFMGPTGAGKSIQGQRLAKDIKLPWISTGELLRQHIAEDEGERKDMLSGKLLGDDHLIRLVDEALTALPKNECVLDGFPRTKAQGEWLIEQVKIGRIHVEAVIHLEVSEVVTAARLQSRGRPDDTTESIQRRYHDYINKTVPIIDELKKAGITVCKINGETNVEDVHRQILLMLGR